ncbi:acyl-homoserine-lactone synthase [Phaeobacter sp. PT47_59]|uniref:acyl-homoserine-lactone synthase n=1 Tax=Phaeobacter sp. PT47_59 TaxID=3029979 RepID=UPI0023800038|nr:acyl-homoserine-lactone synthase [Phaeobacter sp. PT47_59]MDE4175770.1 acyl-homoserine-lactone synthase [Phaeobacter sp. PT47_59]
MRLHVFSFDERCRFEKEFLGFLALRKRKLVDELGWSLHHFGGLEKDQYDRTGAIYSVVTNQGGVVAGARASSCRSSDDKWSYMLKDASEGKLPGIPGGLLSEYPETNETWECTRFVMDETQADQELPSIETKLVVAGLCEAASTMGATELISLSPPGLGPLLRRFGYRVYREPARYVCDDDGREYRAFRMKCDPRVNRDLAVTYGLEGEGVGWGLTGAA